MVKRLTKHTIYEVWNEYVAESVFVDHKPSYEEVKDIVQKEKWLRNYFDESKLDWYTSQFVHVEKLEKIYTKQ